MNTLPPKNEKSIFDDLELIEKERCITTSIQWWEEKRLGYNLIMGIVGLFEILHLLFTHNFRLFDIIFILFYGIVANAFYCIGWGVEVLIFHYFNKMKIDDGGRFILWVLGVLFSVILTISIGFN